MTRTVLAFTLALTLTAMVFVSETVVKHRHPRGTWQPAASAYIAVCDMLRLPAKAIIRMSVGIPVHGPTPARRAAEVAILLSVYAALGFMLIRPEAHPRSVPGPAAQATNYRRRMFLTRSTRAAVGLSSAGAAYAMFRVPFELEITSHTIPIRNLPPTLNGLRLVQISDIHHGPWFALEHVRHLVRQANELAPDIVLLTGDYVQSSGVYIRPVAEALAQLRPSIGTVGVLGNHDWMEGGPTTQAALRQIGVHLLDNTRRVLTPDRRIISTAPRGLCLAGIGDLWRDSQDYPAALDGLPSDMPRLLLSHNPDAAEDYRLLGSKLRVDLMVSGHLHGGQVVLPLIGAPHVPSEYGQKYLQGLVQGPQFPVYISRGIGMAMLPIRLGATPELALLTLSAAS